MQSTSNKTPFLYVFSMTFRVSFFYLLLFSKRKLTFVHTSTYQSYDSIWCRHIGRNVFSRHFVSNRIMKKRIFIHTHKKSAISNKFQRSLPWSRIAKNSQIRFSLCYWSYLLRFSVPLLTINSFFGRTKRNNYIEANE